MKKIFPWLILITFIIALGAFLLIEIYRFTKSIDYSELTLDKMTEKKTITLILVGDIMLNRGVEYMVEKEGKGDFRFPFLKIAEELQKADILLGNLEGVISDKGIRVGSIYSFRADPKAIEGLSFAGFNVLSLANNHAFDYTREALEDTFLRLKEAGIDYLGAGFNENEAFSPIIKEINGVKIAFLAYTNLGPESWKAVGENSGIAWIGKEDRSSSSPFAAAQVSEKEINKIKKDIKSAKENADILIVSLHTGEEYIQEPTQFQIEFAKAAIDAGADLVIGHHPHIIQKGKKYPEKKSEISNGASKNGWIFYSLGNFVFDQSFSEETMQGQILEVIIKDKEIKEIIPREIKINNFFQPEISE